MALGLQSSDEVTECCDYLKETQNTDELIKKLHFFKFGEHYRLLDEIENASQCSSLEVKNHD